MILHLSLQVILPVWNLCRWTGVKKKCLSAWGSFQDQHFKTMVWGEKHFGTPCLLGLVFSFVTNFPFFFYTENFYSFLSNEHWQITTRPKVIKPNLTNSFTFCNIWVNLFSIYYLMQLLSCISPFRANSFRKITKGHDLSCFHSLLSCLNKAFCTLSIVLMIFNRV